MSSHTHPGLSALADSIGSLFGLSTVAAVAIGFAIATALNHAGTPDLGGAIFGADAALVALIVPTAALANAYLEGRMLQYLGKILTGGEAKKVEMGDSVDNHAHAVVSSVKPLLRGFVFLLVSFGLAIAGLIHSTHPVWPSGPGWLRLPPPDLYAGGALGFASVGVLLLFPFAWSLLDRKLAEKTAGLIHWQAEQYRIGYEAAQRASVTPTEPDVAGGVPASTEQAT